MKVIYQNYYPNLDIKMVIWEDKKKRTQGIYLTRRNEVLYSHGTIHPWKLESLKRKGRRELKRFPLTP